jgi:integrase
MSAMRVTEFMLHLSSDLVEKKKVTESTAGAYIRTLYALNGKEPFKNLTFLKKTDEITKKVEEYADNTQKSMYSAVASVLSLFADKPTFKKAYAFYYDKMMGKAKDMKENGPASSEKSEKQKDNWMTWEEVKAKRDGLGETVKGFVGQKQITPEQFQTLLHSTVLSLYTENAPRRNQDYMDMSILRVKDKASVAELPKDKNYLIVKGGKPTEFIFNKFKTSKKYGQQTVPVAPDLVPVLEMYLKHHPLCKGNKGKTVECKFLVAPDGTAFHAPNTITRMLNTIFGKKVGSSMMRHIYLSSKYDVSEMEKDANEMGHSMEEQRKYLKTEAK